MEDDFPQQQTSSMAAVVSGPTFLDTIPEDQSVAAARIANLSTASAVASSDSSGSGGGASGDNPNSPESHRRRRRRRRRRQSPHSETSGVSDTPALLVEGGTSDETEQAPGIVRTNTSVAEVSKRTWIFYGVLSLLLLAIVVGVYFIIENVSAQNHKSSGSGASSSSSVTNNNNNETQVPTLDITFAPFDLDIHTSFPSFSPSMNQADLEDMDIALLKVSDSDLYYDPSSSQGQCRYWMSRIDSYGLRVVEDGQSAVQQRYILCVLYYATKGPTVWNSPFIDKDLHECDWEGVSCDTDHVVILDLRETNLEGSLPEEINYLNHLQAFICFGNGLVGTIPTGLFSLPKLIWCDLSENRLQGEIPPGTSPLEVLFLHGNLLVGTLPYFSLLEKVWVNQNMLTGFDPRYTSLNTLVNWRMYDNLLEGPLPTVWEATNLQEIDFAYNDWTGSIPDSLWNLPLLENLGLHDCQLTGTLPSTTSGENFQSVWMHSNQLSGAIPSTLGWNWTNLTSLLLHNNLLTGTIGSQQCQRWVMLEKLCLDESLSCACCTVCNCTVCN